MRSSKGASTLMIGERAAMHRGCHHGSVFAHAASIHAVPRGDSMAGSGSVARGTMHGEISKKRKSLIREARESVAFLDMLVPTKNCIHPETSSYRSEWPSQGAEQRQRGWRRSEAV